MSISASTAELAAACRGGDKPHYVHDDDAHRHSNSVDTKVADLSDAGAQLASVNDYALKAGCTALTSLTAHTLSLHTL
jgi:hypothetical protein